MINNLCDLFVYSLTYAEALQLIELNRTELGLDSIIFD